MFQMVRSGLWYLYLLFILFFTLMGISSYFRYSTAGVDFEEPTENGVDVFYYRVRWDDGCTWIGMAIQPVPRPDRPLDWFDPGGTFLSVPTHPAHGTWMQKWGFWCITDPVSDPYVFPRYGGATTSYWLGMPTSLLVLILWFPVMRWCFKFTRSAKKTPASGV